MKTNYLFSTILIVMGMVCLTAGCTATKKHPKEEDRKSHQRISFLERTFRMKSNNVGEQGDTTSFFISYPVFSDTVVNKFIMNTLVLDSAGSSVEAMGQEFIKDFDDYFPLAEVKHTWFEETKISVVYQSPHFIGLQKQFSSYTGGAHGIHYVYFYNYNIPENRLVKITDVVSDTLALKGLGEELFRKQEGLSPETSLKENYFFNEGEFSLPETFILTKEGILFLYNIYEIKPYVSGITQLLIPYKELSPLLSTKGEETISEIKETVHANL